MPKMSNLNVKRLHEQATLPTRAYEHDAGVDLYSSESFTLPSHTTTAVATGVAMEIPVGCVGLIRDRSSMGKQGIATLAGVVDAGYRGEVLVMLHNLNNGPIEFEAGAKIAQMLILPVSTAPIVEVGELADSERGERGFGSSGG